MIRIILALILLTAIEIPESVSAVYFLVYIPLLALMASGVNAEKQRGRWV